MRCLTPCPHDKLAGESLVKVGSNFCMFSCAYGPHIADHNEITSSETNAMGCSYPVKNVPHETYPESLYPSIL